MLRVISYPSRPPLGIDVTPYVMRLFGHVAVLASKRDVEDAEKLITALGARHVGMKIDAKHGKATIVDYYEVEGVKIQKVRQDVGYRKDNCRYGIGPAVPVMAIVEGTLYAPIRQEGERVLIR